MLKRILIISLVIWFTACSSEEATVTEPQLRPVKTFIVGGSDEGAMRSFPGVVDANQKAELSFRVSGKLTSLNVKEGDLVTEGQLLATLDDSDFNIELQEAQASYSKAKADLDRAKLLIQKGHISKADFDKLTSAEVGAKAHLDSIKQKLIYSQLKAPFTGQVAKRYIENFQEVGASQTIFLLQDLSSLEVNVDIPASVMVNAKRDISTIAINAQFDAIPDRKFPLKVKEVSTVPDEVTQTYSVKLRMENVPGYNILPGMTTTVKASNPVATGQTIFIPSSTISGSDEQAYVWLIDEQADGTGIIKKQNVTLGDLGENGFEVLNGLNEGQAIVAAGVSKVTDGMSVRLKKD